MAWGFVQRSIACAVDEYGRAQLPGECERGASERAKAAFFILPGGRAVNTSASHRPAHSTCFSKSMVLERLSKRGLSDEQLASMDHPYARRHGSIKSINSNPTEYVGMRTGSIIRSLKGGMKGAKTYSLGFKNPPTHGQLIFQGTRIMLPRNPLMVVADPQKQSTLLKVFQKVVKL